MVDPVVADPFPPPNPNLSTTTAAAATDFDGLPFPPLDHVFLSQDQTLADCGSNSFLSFGGSDVVEDLDFDFTFDDLYLPPDADEFFSETLPDSIGMDDNSLQAESNCFNQMRSDPGLRQICFDRSSGGAGGLNSSSMELHGVTDDQSSSGGRVLNSGSPELCQVSGDQCSDVAGYLNFPSPESGKYIPLESGNKGLQVNKVPEYPSNESQIRCPEVSEPASSQGSGNCDSAVSETRNCPSPDSGNCARSVSSSANFANNSISGVVDQKMQFEGSGNNCLSKRKKENEDASSAERTSKCRRSIDLETVNTEEEEKKKARLMRNRESAQLSRQRKKHYVEELEDKVRSMHSTIQDLNAKISYIVAENASLRQQLGAGSMCPPPVPPPGMYPHPPMAPMGYPWMPCPPYVVKSQGSQVPLVPIPRIKPQQPSTVPKTKKIEGKKSEAKIKKVASVSFLGLVFFILLFGGLVPMVNVRYGAVREGVTGGLNGIGSGFYEQHHGRVLTVNGHFYGTDHNVSGGMSKERESHTLPKSDGSVHSGNASESLVASLYVPRNDKLVKIDGNLIIHSVLASEKAMASNKGTETGLAVPGNLAPAISVSGAGRNSGRHPHLYVDNLKATPPDGRLQQWFREGLTGPMLSSSMCTEVFNFDVSPASASGAIVPATSVRNVSELRQNSTHLSRRNRRFLPGHPIPLAVSSNNLTKERTQRDPEKENFNGNNSLSSSMVVSVLVDPREAGDNNDGDGVMGPKSLSRIFVVVLMDSVKYVTYSCMLPLKGSGPHLVTT